MNKTFEIQKVVVVKEKTVEYEAFEKPIISSSNVVDISRGLDIHRSAEELFCIYSINAKGQIIAFHEASHGDLCSTTTHPREIFKSCVLSNAASVLLLHNHPSGKLSPSKEDTMLTDRMLKLCDLIGIPLVDHIIVGGDNLSYFSFKEKELLSFERNKYHVDYHNIEFPEVAVAEPAAPIRHRKR